MAGSSPAKGMGQGLGTATTPARAPGMAAQRMGIGGRQPPARRVGCVAMPNDASIAARTISWPAWLAPFQLRGFRFQFPADLATSWGVEMENLVLGWYILVETDSVLALTVYWALLYLGTLLAPLFGMLGDRVGHRAVLSAMRASYAVLGVAVMALAFAGVLRPIHVFVIAGLSGLIRPSDQGMRNALVAAIVPPDRLMAAVAVSRTTSDSARIFGALS